MPPRPSRSAHLVVGSWLVAGSVGCTSVLPCEETLTCAASGSASTLNGGSSSGSDGGAQVDGALDSANGASGSVSLADTDASQGGIADCGGSCAAEDCCEGECVDTDSSLEHCGACGNRCEHPGAVSQCIDGECEFVECEDTHLDCNDDQDDGCEAPLGGGPGVPELQLPLNGAHTGSFRARSRGTLKPSFAWREVPRSGCAVSYELQLDDSCALDAPSLCQFLSLYSARSITTDAPRFTPTSDLPGMNVAPVGARYTWRVRACDDQNRCSEWSLPRYVNVGRAENDLDGDGYTDVVAVESGGLVVYRGKGNFGEGTPAAPLDIPGVNLGDSPTVRWLGDVNADGFADLGVGAHLDSNLTDKPTLLFGGADPADLVSVELDPQLDANQIDADYAVEFAPLGDHDGDGLDDFAILASPAVSQLYLGARDLDEQTTPAASFEHTADGEAWGGLVGDMTGDGLDDAVLAVEDTELVVFPGSADGDFEPFVLEPDPTCPGVNAGKAQEILGGDLDDDGFADFVRLCTATGAESLVVHRGGEKLSDRHASLPVASAIHGIAVDLDADGITDLLVQQDDQDVAWYVGGITFLADATGDAGAAPTRQTGSFDPSVAARRFVSGDYDSDGFPDLCFDDPSGTLRCAGGNGSLALPPFRTFANGTLDTLGW